MHQHAPFRLGFQTIYGFGNGITNIIYKMVAVPSGEQPIIR